jgi:RNA polymerase sigma-54 factor
MLNQRLQQRLVQKLSPQQVLVMRLLQEPLLALEQRIKQEIEENPALELVEENPVEEDKETLSDEPITDSIDSDEDEFSGEEEQTGVTEDDFSFEDYMQEDEIPEYRLNANNTSSDDEIHETPIISDTSYQDYLLSQLGLIRHTDKEHIIAATIIGNIDESGYLQRDIVSLSDDLAFNQNLDATPEEILKVLKMIQGFDPAGIGSRNLQECLLLQLERRPEYSTETELATEIIRDHFSEFIKKHYDKILLKTRVSESRLKKAIDEIQKLNPKPGSVISGVARENHYVVPDFIINNFSGELELTLNSQNTPELNLNRQYLDMLRQYSSPGKPISASNKATVTFIKQKLESAKGFMDALKQRQETLYSTMNAIMEYQKEYFLTGDETRLRPMILKDIANIVNLDISTISRVANSKYVQTPFGTLLLKSFFSESMQNTKGEEISTREVKKILQDCIESEDKSDPLTDEQLVEVLKEKSYNIARRTIAKYREQLNIPVARLRKEL